MGWEIVNLLNAELNPICHLLPLLGAHHILHVSSIGATGAVCNHICLFWTRYIKLIGKQLIRVKDFTLLRYYAA